MGQISKEAQYSFLVQYAGGFLWTWEVNQGPQVNVAVWSGWYQRRPVVHSQRGGPGGQHHKTQLHARRSAPLLSSARRRRPQLIRLEAALLTFSQVIIAALVNRSAINLPPPARRNYRAVAGPRALAGGARKGNTEGKEGEQAAREREPSDAAPARGLKCTTGTRR